MSRVLSIAALGVAAAVTAAVFLLGDDGPGEARVALERPGTTSVAGPRADALDPTLARPAADEAASLALPPGPPVDDPLAAAHALGRPALTAHVGGLLLDADGAPIVGEPVDLLVLDDPWEARERGVDDDLAPPEPIARAVSSTDGRFVLAARAGAAHALLAGGRRFARLALPDVHAGDDLRLVLEPAGVVRGIVLDPEGLPVPGAHVAVLGDPQQTLGEADDEGRFELSPLSADPVRVVGWCDGFGVGALDDVQPGGDDVELELPWTRDLVVRVVARGDDEPVAGAHVELSLDLLARDVDALDPLPDLHHLATLEGDAADDGRAVIPGAPSVGFALAVTADGYFPSDVDKHRTRPVRDDEEVVVWMRPLGTFEARVIDGETGEPVPGADVSVLDEHEQVQFEAQSDADGLAQLVLDDWRGAGRPELLAVDALGRSARVRPGKDEVDGGEEIELPLRAPVELRVQVVDAGEPVAGAEVCARSGGQARTLGETDATGFVELEHRLQGGRVEGVRVEARFGERTSLSAVVELEAERDPSEPIVLDLADGLFVAGLVADSAGQPVPGARIAGHGYADVDGRFSAGPFLADDRPKLVVSADGMRTTTVRPEVPVDDLLVTLEPVIVWEGRVRDAASTLPLDDFVLRLEREDVRDGVRDFHDVGGRVHRDPLEAGAFAVELPDEGRYRLRVGARDMLQAYTYAVDFDGVHAPPFADVLLSPAAVLWITLLDASGAPVAGVNLSVFDFEATRAPKRDGRRAGAIANTRTGDDGRARFPLGTGGSFRVAAGRGGWLDDGRIDVAPGPPQERTFRLGPTGDVVVRLTDAQGRPVERAKITLRSQGREGPSVHRTLRPEGAPDEVRVERLPPGTYALEVRQRALGAPAREVVVGPGRTTFVDVLMTEGGDAGRGRDDRRGDRGRGGKQDVPGGKSDKGGKDKNGKAKDGKGKSGKRK
ncbi:MAG: carboxypeptidase regulatory-like domain-containing protein [Planctomycetes bacterium]|nr:carboxypeptidase regulatory-like domain-containing protein [Planctomycetota bacterium]